MTDQTTFARYESVLNLKQRLYAEKAALAALERGGGLFNMDVSMSVAPGSTMAMVSGQSRGRAGAEQGRVCHCQADVGGERAWLGCTGFDPVPPPTVHGSPCCLIASPCRVYLSVSHVAA